MLTSAGFYNMRAACPLPYVQCCPPSGSVLSRPWVVLSHIKDFFVKTLGYLRNLGSSTPGVEHCRALPLRGPCAVAHQGLFGAVLLSVVECCRPLRGSSAVAHQGFFSECLGRCRPSAPGPVSGIKDFFVYFGSIVGLTHECYRL